MSQTVGLAMIVRDAAAVLPRCLSSVARAVDEIVIVDTGSLDDTREVARRFTDKVPAFTWRDDFAAARQFAFDQATTDWVMWLDADDWVEGSAAIRQTIENCPADVGAVHWKYVAGRDSFGNTSCEFWRERCVRNDGTYRWKGRVHEVIVGSTSRRGIFAPETIVVHERDKVARRDPTRNLRILHEEYRGQRCGTHPRLLFYLASEYADVGEYRTAVYFLERFLAVSRWHEQNYLAQLKLAGLLRLLGLYEYALYAGHRALRLIPRWSLAYFSIAETCYYRKRWREVIEWVERGRTRVPPATVCIVNPMDWRFRWMIHYTNALFHSGRIGDALAWTRQALEIRPQDSQHLANLRWFEDRVTPRRKVAGDCAHG